MGGQQVELPQRLAAAAGLAGEHNRSPSGCEVAGPSARLRACPVPFRCSLRAARWHRHTIGTVRASAARTSAGKLAGAVYYPSAYKNQHIPHQGELCSICALRTRRDAPAVLVHLTHGVTLWLCPMHASEEFLNMRGGRDFATTMIRIWSAAGCYTRSRSQALRAHLKRLGRPRLRAEADLPGSYHWKALRNETEHRAAQGEPLRSIVHDLRNRHAHDHGDAPSERTIRRWYTDRRWARGVRTRLRPGFDCRDLRKAANAQRERAEIARLRGHDPPRAGPAP